MTILVLAFLIGVVAGLRALTAPAVVSWGTHVRWISLAGTPLAFLDSPITFGILALLALAEIGNDKRPTTPSRNIPPQFITRIVTGSCTGAAVGLSHETQGPGLIAGALGGVTA